MTVEDSDAPLCDALMGVLGSGAHDVPGIVNGLNKANVPPPGAHRWTEELFLEQLRQRAQTPEKKPSPAIVRADYDAADEPGLRRPGDGAPTPRNVEERTEYLLRQGIRNQWYCIAASSQVSDKPLGIQRLGERLVLWRDKEGKVRALEDRCPHRGVALSVGEVQEGVLACAYHGVQVDGSGRVVRVPALADCPLEGRKLVRAYPVIEHYHAIWAYFGDEKHPAPAPLELPAELVSPEWSGMLHFDTWEAHYRYIHDNLCDPMHGPYLHAKSYTLSGGSRTDQVAVQKTEQGFANVRVSQKRGNIDLLEFVDNASTYYTRVEVPLPPTAGPGDIMRIIFYVTPIEDNRSQIHGWRLRKVSGWQRDLWHFLFKVRLRNFTNAVLEQDKRALSAMPPWPPAENLYQHDLGVVRVRKHLRDAAHSQAREFFRDARAEVVRN